MSRRGRLLENSLLLLRDFTDQFRVCATYYSCDWYKYCHYSLGRRLRYCLLVVEIVEKSPKALYATLNIMEKV